MQCHVVAETSNHKKGKKHGLLIHGVEMQSLKRLGQDVGVSCQQGCPEPTTINLHLPKFRRFCCSKVLDDFVDDFCPRWVVGRRCQNTSLQENTLGGLRTPRPPCLTGGLRPPQTPQTMRPRFAHNSTIYSSPCTFPLLCSNRL